MRFFTLIMVMLCFNAQAAEVVGYAKFGAVGPRQESLPLAKSSSDAEKIFKALQVPQAGAKKIIEARDGSMECSDFSQGVSKKFVCELMLDVSKTETVVAVASGASTSVTFGGKIAKEIFNSLLVNTTSVRVGATIKSVANLRCVKKVIPGFPVVCTLTGTQYWQM
jgi:hypothetical protein